MDVRFSVIIPAYNAENTIKRCLDSLLQSKRSDIEILLIDDGSTDDTEKICREIAACDRRVKYYKKENGGVSSARNMGLDYAVGEYICFVDSDDFVLHNYFDKIAIEMCNGVDFLMFRRKSFNGHKYEFDEYKRQYFRSADKVAPYLCRELRNQRLNLVCDKVYKRDLIKENNIKFPEQLHIGEDKVFAMRYIMSIHNVKCIKEPLYITSLENENSLSRKIRDDLCDSIFLEHELMLDTVKRSNISKENKKKYFYSIGFSFYRSAYTAIGEIEKFGLSRLEEKEAKKKVCRKYKMNEEKYHCDLHTWFIAWPIRIGFINGVEFALKCKNRKKNKYEMKLIMEKSDEL